MKRITCKTCRKKPKGYRCWFCDDKNLAAQNTPHPAGWPMRSEALAVHPEQRGEATEAAKKAGVPTYFDRIGRPVFTDQGHRKAYMKAFGYRDKNACYGDQGTSSRETERQAIAREQKQQRIKEMTEMFLSGG